jgi:hypothetical protein
VNDFLNDSAKAGLDKSSRRLESVKTILEKSKILQPQVVRATTYAENLDLVTEMQGIIFSNSKDVVYIERASFMYKNILIQVTFKGAIEPFAQTLGLSQVSDS